MIDYKDYPDQDFIKLKYSDALTPIIRRGQSHLNSHTDFISIWLYPVAFHHCIRNIDSPTLKHSELLASHHGDLRLEGYLCPYPSRAFLNSRALRRWVIVWWWCTPISHLYVIPVSSHFLVKRITNPYSTQWPILDKRYCPY